MHHLQKSKSLHYEILADGTKQFVDECTYNEQSENDKPKESEASTEAPTQEQTTQETNANQTGSLHTYKTRMAEYFQSRQHFIFDYPDNWTVIRKRSAMMGSASYYRMKMGQKYVMMHCHI